MGLLFHLNFKGETSHVESSELNHTPGVPACRRCAQGKPVLWGWVPPPADGGVGRDAIQRLRQGPTHLRYQIQIPDLLWTGCTVLSKPLGFPVVY